MPIRPIDIMRSQEVSQIKQVESQKTQHEQVLIHSQFQDAIRQASNKTLQSSKSENDEYRYDAKEKGKNEYFGTNKNKNKKQDEQSNQPKKNTSKKSEGFDILI